MANSWFESVAEAQRRAERRLPRSVYQALVAGTERGLTMDDNVAAFAELGFAPHIADLAASRDLSTTFMGQELALPVVISPTGVQAVHPHGEVPMARAAASRGVAMGLSSFREPGHRGRDRDRRRGVLPGLLVGDRDDLIARLQRARAAGARGIILTLDWSFAHGRDWGARGSPSASTSPH